jgi:hypothetical protein
MAGELVTQWRWSTMISCPLQIYNGMVSDEVHLAVDKLISKCPCHQRPLHCSERLQQHFSCEPNVDDIEFEMSCNWNLI